MPKHSSGPGGEFPSQTPKAAVSFQEVLGGGKCSPALAGEEEKMRSLNILHLRAGVLASSSLP